MAKIKRYTCGNGSGMFESKKGFYIEYSEYLKLLVKIDLYKQKSKKQL